MNTAHLLARSSAAYGERPALALGRRPHASYAALGARVGALGRALRQVLHLRPGDRVALTMRNCPEYLEVLFAIWHAGLVAVPVNAKLHRAEFAYILERSGAAACFVTADLDETVRALVGEVPGLRHVIGVEERRYGALVSGASMPVAEVAPTDPAWLFYTSGTTGRPKGATLTHRNLLAMTLAYFADIDEIGPGDAMLHAAPFSHGSGLYALPHVAKAACNVVPASGRFNPPEIYDLVAGYRGASFFAAPTMVTRLLRAPEGAAADTSNLKTIVCGGAPMYVADLTEAIERWGPKLYQLYGQGESPMTITGLSQRQHVETADPCHARRLGSVGYPRTGVTVRVVDEGDAELPPGSAGEVVVRGDVVMPGYWRDPAATAQALRGGWLHTGDVGALDPAGFLSLKDRVKDLIISGGANVYPREVEEVLLQADSLREVSVVGRPHGDWGEEVVAFVVPNPGAVVDTGALDRLCLDHIARFKRPRDYLVVDALPKNNYGKVLKTELRARLLRLASEAGADPPVPAAGQPRETPPGTRG